jgi:hypothetical protein
LRFELSIDYPALGRDAGSLELPALAFSSPERLIHPEDIVSCVPSLPEAYALLAYMKASLPLQVYQLSPAQMAKSIAYQSADQLGSRGENLINVINYLKENHRKRFADFEKDFSACVQEFSYMTTPADPYKENHIKLKLFAAGNAASGPKRYLTGCCIFWAFWLCSIKSLPCASC